MPARSRINELEGKVFRESLAGPATKSVIDRIQACMRGMQAETYLSIQLKSKSTGKLNYWS